MIFLDDYTNSILQKIYANQNLCKLLAIDDNNNPTSYPDIVDTTTLFTNRNDQRIYTIPYNIDILDHQKTTITINVSDAKLDTNNIYFKEVRYKFFVLCPYNLWQLESSNGESKTRPNAIIQELLTMFNRERTIGLGRNIFTKLYNIFPNQYVGGYCAEFEAHDFIVNG